MAWGRRARYCCTNTSFNTDGRCPYAISDALFSQAQFDAWSGRCQGSAERPGCGQALQPGKPEDRRLRWLATGAVALVAAVVAAVVLRTQVFPAPLEHIAFVNSQTRVNDSAGEVSIEIRRDADADAAVQLRASVVDGSAHAGEDFTTPGLTIAMAPGQSQAQIRIPVLPDKTFRKGERHFAIVLDNVQGQPRHTVVIEPRTGDASGRVLIEKSVLSASRIAADVAGLVVKVEAMEQLLPRLRDDAVRFDEFRSQQKAAAENLVRAREAYLESVQVLKDQPAQQVLSTIDRLAADLRQRNFRQQANVLPVLGRHYEQLLNGHAVDMDRWAHELGQTIPRTSGDGSSVPNV